MRTGSNAKRRAGQPQRNNGHSRHGSPPNGKAEAARQHAEGQGTDENTNQNTNQSADQGETTPNPKPPDPARASDFLANERTFLAWLRTAVALIALGFVVARFGLFLRELAAGATGTTVHATTNHISSIFGTAIVVFSALLLVLAYLRYRQNDLSLLRGEYTSDRLLLTAAMAVITLISLLLAAYLLLTS